MIVRKLAIVGAGPNSLYALDYILKSSIEYPLKKITLEIDIFEKNNEFGPGLHLTSTLPEAKLNRIAGQISLSSKKKVKFNLSKNTQYFETFLEWSNYMFMKTKDIKYRFRSDDWPPRYILGEALKSQFSVIVNLLRENKIKIRLKNENVKNILLNKKSFDLITCKSKYTYNEILVVNGTPQNNRNNVFGTLFKKDKSKKLHHFCNPFPLEKMITNIDKLNKNKVFVIGGGATGIDVINSLLVNFQNINIYPYTRSGLIAYARPINQKFQNKHFYKGKMLRAEFIINFLSNNPQLNFKKTSEFILRLLEFEASYAYINFISKAGYYSNKKTNEYPMIYTLKDFKDFVRNYKKESNEEIKKIAADFVNYLISKSKRKSKRNFKSLMFLYELFDKEKKFVLSQINNQNKKLLITKFAKFIKFNWNSVVYPLEYIFKDIDNNHNKVLSWMKYDIEHATAGNLVSPLKFVTDGVLRDCRKEIMSPLKENFSWINTYHEVVIKKFLPIHNRLADGSCLDIYKYIYEAAKVGRVNFSFSRKISTHKYKDKYFLKKSGLEQNIEISIEAISATNHVTKISDLLFKNLMKSKMINLIYTNKGYQIGLNLNKNFNPITAHYKILKNFTILGAASEGRQIFNHTLGRSDQIYPVLDNINKWGKKFYDKLKKYDY